MTARSEHGFSLVELTGAAAVLLVLLGALVQTNNAASQLTSTTLAVGRLEATAGRAMVSVGSELRWARPDTMLITKENGSSRLDFVASRGYVDDDVVWSAPITLRYEPSARDTNGNGTPDEGSLVWLEAGARRVVCRNVKLGGFVVTRNGDLVQTEITVFAITKDRRLVERTVAVSTALVNPEGA